MVQRPTRALERLRALARENPSRTKAYRRLGNGCQRFGRLDEALGAWRRAMEVDPLEIEAAASLADVLLCSEKTADEGSRFLDQAVANLAKVRFDNLEERRWNVELVFALLRETAESGSPVALMAAWSGGGSRKAPVMHVSSVELRKVLHVWDRLLDFVTAAEPMALSLTNELPGERTKLQSLPEEDDRLAPVPRQGFGAPKVRPQGGTQQLLPVWERQEVQAMLRQLARIGRVDLR